MIKKTLTVKEIAEKEGRSLQTIRRWARNFGLPYNQIGRGKITVDCKAFDEWKRKTFQHSGR